MSKFTVKPIRDQWWLIAPRGTHLRAFPTWDAAKSAADRANGIGKSQATRIEELAEARRQQAERLELLVLFPLGVMAVSVIGYALGMFLVS